MHIFDEVTEQIQIVQQMIKDSNEFTDSQKYDLVNILEEVENKISEIA